MKKDFLIILSTVFLAFACERENLIPGLEGSLVGYVYTFDEFANQLNDRSGVFVTAVGSKNHTAFTDENGRFEIAELPTGTYELRFEKPGFGTLRQYGIKHLGGKPTTLGLSYSGATNSEAFFIYQIPKTRITSASVTGNKLSCSFSFNVAEPPDMSVLLYLSATDGFKTTDASQTLPFMLTKENGTYSGTFEAGSMAFSKGEKVYAKVCQLMRRGAVTDYGSRIIAGIDTYTDPENNTLIYPNLGNESAQFSFIVP